MVVAAFLIVPSIQIVQDKARDGQKGTAQGIYTLLGALWLDWLDNS